jgi:hypothetical protein
MEKTFKIFLVKIEEAPCYAWKLYLHTIEDIDEVTLNFLKDQSNKNEFVRNSSGYEFLLNFRTFEYKDVIFHLVFDGFVLDPENI